jgi:hypothetical protein
MSASGRVEVVPVLLGVLAVVALAPGEPEDPLLEDRIATVPEREREAQRLTVVADPAQAVLVPPVGARARMVVREELPGITAGAVILADRSPGAFAQIRTPPPPDGTALRDLQ